MPDEMVAGAPALQPELQPETHPPLSEGGPLAAQLIALLLAPFIFLARLETAYVLVPWACNHGGEIWIHVVSWVAIAVALVGAVVGWRLAHAEDGDDDRAGHPPMSRVRFVGIMGSAIAALTVLLLVAQWVPALYLTPCQ